MNEKEPIKRSQALKELSKDHHFNLLFIWKIRQGLKMSVELSRIQKFIRYFFHEQILHHFSVEEKHLFCLLPEDDVLRIQAEEEHSNIKRIAEIILSDKFTEAEIIEFINLLESHIRFEERTLFNYIEKIIPDKKLKEFLINFRQEQDADWKDAFWIA